MVNLKGSQGQIGAPIFRRGSHPPQLLPGRAAAQQLPQQHFDTAIIEGRPFAGQLAVIVMDDGQNGHNQGRIGQRPDAVVRPNTGLKIGGLAAGHIGHGIDGLTPAADQGINLFRLQGAHIQPPELFTEDGLPLVSGHPRGDQIAVVGVAADQFMHGVPHVSPLLAIGHLIQAIGHNQTATGPHQPFEKIGRQLERGKILGHAGGDEAKHSPAAGIDLAPLPPTKAGKIPQGQKNGHRHLSLGGQTEGRLRSLRPPLANGGGQLGGHKAEQRSFAAARPADHRQPPAQRPQLIGGHRFGLLA